jgi:endonuclease YncB( thermonuclease family)
VPLNPARLVRAVCGFALAAALLSCLAACGDATLDALPSAGVASVAGVSAGESLRLRDGRAVTLAGVDVADDAALRALLLGQEVELLDGGGGEAGRYHLRRRRDRRWVQGELLDAGVARVRTTANDRTLAAAMLSREARARRDRRGLWAGRWRVLTADEAVDARGFQIVEGRVRSARALRRGVFLDFGEDWRRDVSVEVPDAALDAFAAAGVDPEELDGRLVRVRGRLERTRNGPLMVLNHPEALELLRE